ncbi:MAG: NAD(P)/FAD-dependent oxidoreductase [Janthinobacterium lividum]
MDSTIDCVVIGGGVIGLAIARACALQGWESILLEAEPALGTVTSARNSEVIHAGLYYAKGSLKARLCVAGKAALYRYAEDKQIEYRRCGKLLVATTAAQLPMLSSITSNAAANGVHDLRLLHADEANRLEPALRCVAALESPSTGIIDSHGLMQALRGDFETAGGMVAFASPVLGGGCVRHGDATAGITLEVGGAEPMQLTARRVVNAAGLFAQQVAASLRDVPAASIPPARFVKGNYFSLTGRSPFSRLIYPMPENAGLGVHLTLDLGGQARFGPDVEPIEASPDAIDYRVDARRADSFYGAIRRYWPDLADGALAPAYAGVRPQLAEACGNAGDFVIQDVSVHGVAGLINLYGIESPGLTACLALADMVVGKLIHHGQAL